MSLDQWLILNEVTEAAFAARIGTTQAAVNRYRRAVRFPGPDVMQKIQQATGFAVTVADFYRDRELAAKAREESDRCLAR